MDPIEHVSVKKAFPMFRQDGSDCWFKKKKRTLLLRWTEDNKARRTSTAPCWNGQSIVKMLLPKHRGLCDSMVECFRYPPDWQWGESLPGEVTTLSSDKKRVVTRERPIYLQAILSDQEKCINILGNESRLFWELNYRKSEQNFRLGPVWALELLGKVFDDMSPYEIPESALSSM